MLPVTQTWRLHWSNHIVTWRWLWECRPRTRLQWNRRTEGAQIPDNQGIAGPALNYLTSDLLYERKPPCVLLEFCNLRFLLCVGESIYKWLRLSRHFQICPSLQHVFCLWRFSWHSVSVKTLSLKKLSWLPQLLPFLGWVLSNTLTTWSSPQTKTRSQNNSAQSMINFSSNIRHNTMYSMGSQ